MFVCVCFFFLFFVKFSVTFETGADGIGSGLEGGAPSLSDLEKEVAADVAGLSEVFSDARAFSSDSEEQEDAG